EMKKAAGDWNISSVTTNPNRTNPRTGQKRINCYAIGGELARHLGWVWPDFVVHMYGDDVLEDIGYRYGLLKHVESAVFDNLLVRDGRMPRDGNHNRMFKGLPYIPRDRMAYGLWKQEFDANGIRGL